MNDFNFAKLLTGQFGFYLFWCGKTTFIVFFWGNWHCAAPTKLFGTKKENKKIFFCSIGK
jgi:hypothetical protein